MDIGMILLNSVCESITRASLNITIKDIKPSKIDDHATYGCKEQQPLLETIETTEKQVP